MSMKATCAYPLSYFWLLLQVYQVISPYTSRLDNVLELYTGTPSLAPAACTVQSLLCVFDVK